MPFKSQAQRGFMYAKKPALAKEFEAATPKGKKLPEHVKKSGPKSISLKAYMTAPKKPRM